MPRPTSPDQTTAATGEQGSITVWSLGLAVMLLFVGGLSLDLWRAFSERQALANAADAASIAGGSAIDVPAYRASGRIILDPDTAEQRVLDHLALQGDTLSLVGPPQVVATPEQVEVVLHGQVSFTLLNVLLPPGQPPFTIQVRAVAEPQGSLSG